MHPVRFLTLLTLLTTGLRAGAPPPPEIGVESQLFAGGPGSSGKPKFNGCVPATAAGFHGKVEGAVETIDPEHRAFKLKVTRVFPSKENRAPEPKSLVGAVVAVKRDYGPKTAEGKPRPKPGHTEFIASLKPGDIVRLSVGYHGPLNCLKIQETPSPPARESKPAPPASTAPSSSDSGKK